MARVKDMTGMKFGRLTIVKESGRDKHRNTLWLCKCECGNETIVRGINLKNGRTTSCGCLRNEKTKERWEDKDFRKKHSEKTKEKWQDEEYRQMKSNEMREQWEDEEFRKKQRNGIKEQWKDEEMKWKMGYKGGITPISKYLRVLNEQWFNDCKQQANYTCELTGKVGGNLHTHHLKAFNTIVLEAHELNNIEIHEIIGEYTQEELHKLEEYVASWHKDNSNAVLLCKEGHDLFHSLYGQGNNTPEQYEQFKQRYLSGEFEENIK